MGKKRPTNRGIKMGWNKAKDPVAFARWYNRTYGEKKETTWGRKDCGVGGIEEPLFWIDFEEYSGELEKDILTAMKNAKRRASKVYGYVPIPDKDFYAKCILDELRVAGYEVIKK
jgi:hypothetical protein